MHSAKPWLNWNSRQSATPWTLGGAMNMAGQLGAFSTSVAFGYIVSATGSYDLPLIPMAVMTIVSALLWLKIDPTQSLNYNSLDRESNSS